MFFKIPKTLFLATMYLTVVIYPIACYRVVTKLHRAY